MKLLKDILNKVSLVEVRGSTELEITNVVFDSRKVQKGSLYVAVRGVQVDGHQFIPQAIQAGAVAVLCEEILEGQPEVVFIQTDDARKALGIVANNYYDYPSSKLTLVGITGTNGKTSVATLLHRLFQALGYKVGLLSTVENKIDEEVIPSTHTTPDPLSLNALLSQMVKAKCTHAFMEVSSHAIHQHRIAGLDFDGGIFMNISHDHLDYHKTFDEYIKAKKGLFDQLSAKAFALVNIDDKRGRIMVQNSKASVKGFALKNVAEYKARVLSNTIQGLELDIENQPVWFKLIGAFNAYNILASYAAALELGEDAHEVLTSLSLLEPVNGRFNQIVSKERIVGIIDYAHTPDALENVLKTIQHFKENHKVITVVGCGGNRDKAKRPKMAEIACKLSDQVILTSDNPRDEEPDMIISDMKTGLLPTLLKKTITIGDRREAIKLACTFAESEDIILIAGKGHENYQEIRGEKIHFDDKEELYNAFQILEK